MIPKMQRQSWNCNGSRYGIAIIMAVESQRQWPWNRNFCPGEGSSWHCGPRAGAILFPPAPITSSPSVTPESMRTTIIGVSPVVGVRRDEMDVESVEVTPFTFPSR